MDDEKKGSMVAPLLLVGGTLLALSLTAGAIAAYGAHSYSKKPRGSSQRRTKYGTRGLTYAEAERRQNEVPANVRHHFHEMARNEARGSGRSERGIYLRMIHGYIEG